MKKVIVKYNQKIAVWTYNEMVMFVPNKKKINKEMLKKEILKNEKEADMNIDWTNEIEILERDLDNLEYEIEQ